MPSLSIKNVPPEVVEQLRKRAQRHHRSLQRELLALVCDAVSEGPQRIAVPGAGQPSRTGTKTLQDIYETHRTRGSAPCLDAPLAVDIIRADRDAR